MKRTILTLSLLAATMSVAAWAQNTPITQDSSKMVRRIESRFDFTWGPMRAAKAILQQEQPVLQQVHMQLAAAR